ncbi:MAG: response regulator transcription factor [Flavobacteriaceae bacterium]
MKYRIAIVEDHKDLLEAMVLMLDTSEKYIVTGCFNNAEEALERVPILQPDAVLMDINLPKLSGIECVSRLKKECPNTLFVMCTSYEDDEKIFQSLEMGASGYILKTDGPTKILQALDDLFEGGSPR